MEAPAVTVTRTERSNLLQTDALDRDPLAAGHRRLPILHAGSRLAFEDHLVTGSVPGAIPQTQDAATAGLAGQADAPKERG